ncbi:MAG: heme-binding domain-containing protein [Deferribacteres bacterium]|nr:heme-binding domain-containing protein [candidate division KSB1 bacterium]MCB9500491.1 heme-binding domain-containing protein [Deferribacteres bacterium]
MKIFKPKNLFLILILIFIIIQFVPVEKTNPPVTAPLRASDDVTHIMKSACYDCHSNETVWPWYSHVAPVSWLLSDHVRNGRRHLNFSAWGEYPGKRKLKKLDEIAEEIEGGNMPLAGYVKMHSEANLSAEQKQVLIDWAHAAMDTVSLD